jgi:hypothetical protein
MNHLRATSLHRCLPLNLGNPRLEIKRIVLDLCGTVAVCGCKPYPAARAERNKFSRG